MQIWNLTYGSLDLLHCAGLPIPGHPGHALRVRYATEHRCGVVIAGPGLCDRISSTDPLKDGLPLQACLAACILCCEVWMVLRPIAAGTWVLELEHDQLCGVLI